MNVFNDLVAYNLLKNREIADKNLNDRNKIMMTTRNFAINDSDLKYRQLANLIAQLKGDAAGTLTRNALKDGLGR